ncbi:Aspartate/tyrosine/aromatic aminotransferase [Leptospira biflexa serovar Patoc strain 'Patoc 1 (Ames)']|uniref:Aminotransferase n=1 Tax=Leptospira biflexa serovar Patoc (strain Patoc 1 / ATCC 23582 / Paris) TaxID=456481 RepID=B0SLN8_LEPBP|nr:pyridoxal phosphate-dependent aminotransferase [Leptospira biflexa]ABZ94950.1 Aspartate/tyrosine/aromatic aminotransferase [Leptospira biflexa serovar Patoc strain 'Patoc 1 (Ames)']ABZ98624.1 Aspartate aminotransferase A (Transaminase A; AspAT) [Leptospira biflexa serovar Patoc strain 'Patoc 1 (Paris)']TGM32302.1 pyridoxal phosphate-dependent aminotransferase [Leptospira biflexa]TGM33868.1 pyridoxal phosphate-dependent aminotransferase [Leptospira biflexa]TGM57455.1 pyridoxal phosphate-depe
MKLVAKRLDVVEPSPTLAITAKANQLKASGLDVVGFGAGEPDFDTPNHIKEAAKKAMDQGKTKYTPVSGTVSLKDAIIKKFETENGLKYEKNQIIVGTGGKQVLYNFFMATLNPGDEVIIPAPYWVSYADIVRLAEGTPVIVATDISSGFKITAEQLEKAITPKTKVFIFNSPSNPTGAAYTRSDVEALVKVLEPKDIITVSDDIYEKIIYDGLEFVNPAMISAKMKEKTFVINGVSKAYSMTGWRIGYGAGNAEIVKNMDTMQGQSTSNASSISQAAAEAALTGDQTPVAEMLKAFDKRRKLIVGLLREIPGVECRMPEGAFYAFPYMTGVYEMPGFKKLLAETKETSYSKLFCDVLLEKYNVAAVPGIAFGDDKAIRLSYALGEKDIEKGVSRIKQMVEDLQK